MHPNRAQCRSIKMLATGVASGLKIDPTCAMMSREERPHEPPFFVVRGISDFHQQSTHSSHASFDDPMGTDTLKPPGCSLSLLRCGWEVQIKTSFVAATHLWTQAQSVAVMQQCKAIWMVVKPDPGRELHFFLTSESMSGHSLMEAVWRIPWMSWNLIGPPELRAAMQLSCQSCCEKR